MLSNYSEYQLRGLKQLAVFKDCFANENPDVMFAKKSNWDLVAEKINHFIEIFCEHDFADNDYNILQTAPMKFETPKEWIEQMDIETILKTLTYIIWTDKSVKGYFIKKINDDTLEMLLARLEIIIKEDKQFIFRPRIF